MFEQSIDHLPPTCVGLRTKAGVLWFEPDFTLVPTGTLVAGSRFCAPVVIAQPGPVPEADLRRALMLQHLES